MSTYTAAGHSVLRAALTWKKFCLTSVKTVQICVVGLSAAWEEVRVEVVANGEQTCGGGWYLILTWHSNHKEPSCLLHSCNLFIYRMWNLRLFFFASATDLCQHRSPNNLYIFSLWINSIGQGVECHKSTQRLKKKSNELFFFFLSGKVFQLRALATRLFWTHTSARRSIRILILPTWLGSPVKLVKYSNFWRCAR